MHKFVRYWLPPFLWMMLIFFMSSRHRVSVTEEFLPDFIIFKSIHILEYAILNVLLFRAFLYESKNVVVSLQSAIVVSILYAFSDEIHQMLIPTRNGTIVDVFIDIIGILGVSFLLRHKFVHTKLK